MKYILLLIAALSFNWAVGQSTYDEKHFTGLLVKDMDASIAWYRDKLGFKVVDTVNNPNSGYRFALLSWNNTLVEIIAHAKVLSDKQIKAALPDNAGTQGFFKLGFFVDNLEEFQEELKSRGVKILHPVLKAEGFTRKLKLFIIEDNEGNMIQFFNYL